MKREHYSTKGVVFSDREQSPKICGGGKCGRTMMCMKSLLIMLLYFQYKTLSVQ